MRGEGEGERERGVLFLEGMKGRMAKVCLVVSRVEVWRREVGFGGRIWFMGGVTDEIVIIGDWN